MKAVVGDIVKIVNEGHIFQSYKSFFNEQGFPDLADRYQGYCHGTNFGRVLFMGRHRRGWTLIYAIELGTDGGNIVLAGEEGIEFISDGDSWDLPEIEKSEIPVNDLLGI